MIAVARGKDMMGYDPRVYQKPTDLKEIVSLSIDRKRDFSVEPKTVCLDLDGTLLRLVDLKNLPESLDPKWVENSIKLNINAQTSDFDLAIIPRPGIFELFCELERYADPIFYTDMKASDVQIVLDALSDHVDSIKSAEKSKELYFADVFAWTQDQCVKTEKGLIKSLSHLSERCSVKINDLWIITDRSENVDIKDRVVEVSSFFGDPNDKELLLLMDGLF